MKQNPSEIRDSGTLVAHIWRTVFDLIVWQGYFGITWWTCVKMARNSNMACSVKPTEIWHAGTV